MIFARHKHAITFALAILAIAVIVADPGGEPAPEPVAPPVQPATVAAMAAPASVPQDITDPEWLGEDLSGSEPAPAAPVEVVDEPAVDMADGGYDLAPPPVPSRTVTSRPAASRPAPTTAQGGAYVPPPPPPQMPNAQN